MDKLIKILKIIILAVIFVGEPILFNSGSPFSIPVLWLESTWPIQAVVGFGLILISANSIKRIIMLAIAMYAILIAGFFLWNISLSPELSQSLDLLISAASGFCLMLIALLITFGITTIKSSKLRFYVRIVALVFILPLCGLASITSWGGEQLRNTAQLGNDHYYLTTRSASLLLSIYKCNSAGLVCKLIFDWQGIDISDASIVADKDSNEILLFLSARYPFVNRLHGLFYVYGKHPRFIRDSTKFGDNIYYLATQQQNAPYTYILLKCNQDSMGCTQLAFQYIGGNKDSLFIFVDDTGKLTIDNFGTASNDNNSLIYSYDIYNEHPVCHIESCTIK